MVTTTPLAPRTPTPVPLSTTVLEVRGLTKRYGKRVVLDGLSLTLERGQVLGMLGPNGAGKTTALCALLGLVRPDEGEIRVLGIDARQRACEALRHVGALVESPTFYPYLTGEENLRILALLRAVSFRRISEVLELVGLAEHARQRVGTYSLGMRQRLAIAAAVLHEPALLVLDEPTNGLDPQGIVEVRELVRTLAAGGQTILLCSHALAEVQQMCTHVLVLVQGRTVVSGALAELLRASALYRLRTPEVERALAVMRETPWIQVVASGADWVRFTMPRDRNEVVARSLLQAGVPVLELSPEDSTLEQLYLTVTDGVLQPVSDRGAPLARFKFWRQG